MTSDSRCKEDIWNNNWLVVGGRVPKIDEETLKILSEESLIVLLNYLDQLKVLFTSFVH